MPLLSVIIPTHNGSKYISQSIESIINQTFSDWELILVDDGSIDDTLHIISQYALKDNRIRVIHREQSTGSVCMPLKIGVRAAIGEYISRIDDDDYIAVDYLEKTLSRLQESAADCVCSVRIPFDEYKIKREETIPPSTYDLQQVISGRDACIQSLIAHTINGNGFVAHRHAYLQILEERSDDEQYYMNTDEIDFRKFLFSLKSVAFADTFYYYRINAVSVTRKIAPRLFERLITNNHLLDFVQQHIDTYEVQRTLEQECRNMLLVHTNIYLRHRNTLSKNERAQIRRTIREAYHGLRHLHKIPFANRKQQLFFSSYIAFMLLSNAKLLLERHRY